MAFYLYSVDKKYLPNVHCEINKETMCSKNRSFLNVNYKQVDILTLFSLNFFKQLNSKLWL